MKEIQIEKRNENFDNQISKAEKILVNVLIVQ